jgi:serine protease
MVLGSYLLAVLIRYISALSMGFAMQAGMLFGGSGLFFLQCFQVVGAPQWPFRLMGSSLSEVGNAAFGSSLLNPLFASILIPFAIMALLWSNRTGKSFATGISIGMAAALGVSSAVGVSVWGLGAGLVSTAFLAVNACLCFSLAWFAARPAH